MKRFKARKTGEGRVVIQARLSYVHLDEPWAGNDGNEKKYSVSCIVPKDDEETLQVIRAAIEEAKQEGKARKWGGVVPKKLSVSLRDGDEEREDEAYEGSMFFSANSRKPVATLNRMKEDIPPEDIYSGCYGLVSVTFFPYDSNGNKGVAAGLNSVMKWADGERLGGGDGRNDFDGFDTEPEDDIDDL